MEVNEKEKQFFSHNIQNTIIYMINNKHWWHRKMIAILSIGKRSMD